jgi:hypothetical protein
MKAKWWKSFPAAAAILLCGCLAHGQSQTRPQDVDQRVELTAGSIQIDLVLPAALQQLSSRKMALVHQQGVPAKFIFNDPASDVILAINTFGSNADENGLTQVIGEIKAAAAKHGADAGSLKSDLITMNGKRWLRLSFKEGAGAAELVNEYFVTDWMGEYVLFNFSLPAAQYESYKDSFERSARSVQLGLTAEANELHPDAAKEQQKKN